MMTLTEDWRIVHERPRDPVDVARVRNAAARIARWHEQHVTRIWHVRLTEHVDLECLRVNVACLVSPSIVRLR